MFCKIVSLDMTSIVPSIQTEEPALVGLISRALDALCSIVEQGPSDMESTLRTKELSGNLGYALAQSTREDQLESYKLVVGRSSFLRTINQQQVEQPMNVMHISEGVYLLTIPAGNQSEVVVLLNTSGEEFKMSTMTLKRSHGITADHYNVTANCTIGDRVALIYFYPRSGTIFLKYAPEGSKLPSSSIKQISG